MKNLNFYKLIKVEVFLIISLIICWLSISTSLLDILNIYNVKKINFVNVSNFFRASTVVIIFPILLFLLFKNFRSFNFKANTLFIFSFLYFLMQLPGFIFYNNPLYNMGFVISSLNILIIFFLINIHFNKKKYSIVFIITFVMLIIITLLNYKAFLTFFSEPYGNSLYTFFQSSETYLGKQSPRSTGTSRTILFLYIISNYLFFKFYNKFKILKYFIYIVTSAFIILFQSRTTIGLWLIFILLNYIFEKNFSFKNLLKYIAIYLILPLLVAPTSVILKAEIYEKSIISSISNNDNSKEELKKELNLILEYSKRPIDPESFSSGRLEDWLKIINNIGQSKIYGFGAQGDRFMINQSASNAFLYALSSGGILGLSFFFLFTLNCLWILLKFFYFSYLRSNQKKEFFIATIVLLLIVRSILESSYSVFSLDYIIFFSFINYLFYFSMKNQ